MNCLKSHLLRSHWFIPTSFLLLLLGLSQPAEAAIVLGESDKPLIELCALVFGGIGIFLIGIHFAGEHLKQMMGGRFEKWVGRFISNRFGVIVLGGGLGFLTQSGKAAAFILADLVQVKLLTSRQAGLVVFWANVGCSLLVFASMLSLNSTLLADCVALNSLASAFRKRLSSTGSGRDSSCLDI